MVNPVTLLGFLLFLNLGGELHLTEIRRMTLPEGAQLSQAVLMSDGETAVLDTRRHSVWVSEGTGWTSFGLPFGFSPVGTDAREGEIRLIDSSGSVATVNVGGNDMGTWSVAENPDNPVVEEIKSAIGSAEGWIGIGPCENQVSETCIFRQESNGGQNLLGRFLTPLTNRGPDRIWISVFQNRGILAQASFPFSRWKIDLETGAVVKVDVGVQSADGAQCPKANWVGLRVLQLGRGTVQSHVDLASDNRCITRYDESGHRETVSLLANPLALVDSRPDQQILLGVQRLNRVNVLVFRWDWG